MVAFSYHQLKMDSLALLTTEQIWKRKQEFKVSIVLITKDSVGVCFRKPWNSAMSSWQYIKTPCSLLWSVLICILSFHFLSGTGIPSMKGFVFWIFFFVTRTWFFMLSLVWFGYRNPYSLIFYGSQTLDESKHSKSDFLILQMRKDKVNDGHPAAVSWARTKIQASSLGE